MLQMSGLSQALAAPLPVQTPEEKDLIIRQQEVEIARLQDEVEKLRTQLGQSIMIRTGAPLSLPNLDGTAARGSSRLTFSSLSPPDAHSGSPTPTSALRRVFSFNRLTRDHHARSMPNHLNELDIVSHAGRTSGSLPGDVQLPGDQMNPVVLPGDVKPDLRGDAPIASPVSVSQH